MVTVRASQARDGAQVAEVVALATKALRQVYRRAAGEQGGARLDASPSVLVAVDGDRVLGVVEYLVRPASLYIQGLAVHPQYQKRGVARLLLAHVERIAIESGMPRLELSTIEETGNAAIFRALGFVVEKASRADGFESLEGQPVTRVDMSRRVG